MVSAVVVHMKLWLEVTNIKTGLGVLWALSPGVKQPVLEADHSPPPNAEAIHGYEDTLHCTSIPSIHFSGMQGKSCFR